LQQQIDIAGLIYNHCIALHRRYYRLTGKSLSQYNLMRHITKLKKLPRYAHWNLVGSQAIQEIVQRIDRAYKLFFGNLKRKVKTAPLGFKKVKKYSSFTLKQAGWKLLDRNRIWIQGTVYKYSKSREIEGQIKTVTVKRDELGNLWLCFAVEHGDYPKPVTSSHIVGLDFGLKTFLTPREGTPVESPQFFKESLADIRRCSRALSRKQKGSHNRRKAIRELARTHARIQNKRNDWFFKLAHRLVDQFDVLVLEDLNLRAMQRMWGRKVSDLGFAHFVDILKHVAAKRGRTVYLVDRFFPSSKTCSACGAINHSLELSERCWVCAVCGVTHDRDLNAALNLAREGASSLGLGDVRPAQQAISV
jgi:putative transposase